jgi:hypothetical protein
MKPARECAALPALLTFAAVAVNRQPDDETDGPFQSRQFAKVVRFGLLVADRMHFKRAGQNAIGVANGNPDSDRSIIHRDQPSGFREDGHAGSRFSITVF